MNKIELLNEELKRLHQELPNTPLFSYKKVYETIQLIIQELKNIKDETNES